MKTILCIAVLSVFALASIGCGPGYKIVEASGTVTLDGKPLSNATVLTQPIGTEDNPNPGPGSFAETDENGHFVLEFQHEAVVGAAPGECYIKIVENAAKRESSDDTAEVVRSKVPWEYQEGGKVTYTIPEEGTDAMNFDLESRRRRK